MSTDLRTSSYTERTLDLTQRLADAEAALQAVAAGKVDTVTRPGSGQVILPEAQRALVESQGRYHRLVMRMSAVVFELGPDGRTVFVNDAVTKVTGYRPDELTGKNWWQTLLRVEDLSRVADIGAMLAAGDVANYHMTLSGKSGSQVLLDVTTANHYRDGRLERIVGFGTDISERSRAQAALSESEARFQQLADSMPQIVWAARPDGEIDYSNKRWYEFSGLEPGHGGDAVWAPYLHPEDAERCKNQWQASVSSGAPFSIEVRLRNRATRKHDWYLVRALPVRDPAGKVQRWFGTCTDINERKHAEDRLRLLQSITLAVSETTTMTDALRLVLHAVCESNGWTIGQAWVPRDDGSVLECSPAFGGDLARLEKFRAVCTRTTLSRGEGLPGEVWSSGGPVWLQDLSKESNPFRREAAAEVGLKAGVAIPVLAGKGGDEFVGVIEFFGPERLDEDAHVLALLTAISSQLGSVLRRKRAEEKLGDTETQLRQAQKMEAIGQLAGGIAHDFNNVLTAILGYSEIVLSRLRAEDPIVRDVEQIQQAGKRAASLTRQLLAFSRKQVLQPRILNINAVVREIHPMLSRLVGESIDLGTVLADDLGQAKLDPGQFEQVIMNLCVNARDAMPDCGKLMIETKNVSLDETDALDHPEVQPGKYILLTVSDTGTGMTKEVMARIYEPFFTTKPLDRGTGLGLSTVYGIVKQSGGYIRAFSEVGRGTTFKVYFRRVNEAEEVALTPSVALSPRGTETVLLVEDDGLVRELARAILTMSGYKVLEASNGREALLMCEQQAGPIHLVLTDVVMPLMSGRQLHERLRAARPSLKAMFMSGYTEDAIFHQGVLDPGINFIQKPFSRGDLARAVRAVLDAPQH